MAKVELAHRIRPLCHLAMCGSALCDSRYAMYTYGSNDFTFNARGHDMNRRTFLTSAAMASIAAGTASTSFAQGKKYRACVIGDTKNGGYGHALHMVYALRDDVEVVALADPDEAGRAKMAGECGAKKTYADYREMLEKEKPNLVTIAPRITTNHKTYLLACAEIGAHGFMEKPLATDVAEADEMIAAIEKKNLRWALGYNFRATPGIQHVKKALLDDAVIGDIVEMRSRGKEDPRAGGEDLIVLGTHLFDLMVFFQGKPQWCGSDIWANGKPATKADVREATEPLGPIVGDSISCTFGFANGVHGNFGSKKNKENGGGRWGIDIYGTKGVVTVRQDVNPAILYMPDPTWSGKQPWQPLPGAPVVPAPKEPEKERYLPLINDLIDSIEKGREPEYSFQKALVPAEMIQAVFESYVSKSRAPLPLKERTHPLSRWA
jgi:predicted dehydrogenase